MTEKERVQWRGYIGKLSDIFFTLSHKGFLRYALCLVPSTSISGCLTDQQVRSPVDFQETFHENSAEFAVLSTFTGQGH